jgi:hypothetical protein
MVSHDVDSCGVVRLRDVVLTRMCWLTFSFMCARLVYAVTEEGMPISKTGGRGDLIIRFHILFPKYLNGVKRTKLRGLLANEESNGVVHSHSNHGAKVSHKLVLSS